VECRLWKSEREEMEAVIGPLNPDTLMEKMINRNQIWEAVFTFAKRVMTQKESLDEHSS